MNTPWEYRRFRLPDTLVSIDREMNVLGEQGWELVSVVVNGTYNDTLLAFFKREKQK